MPPKNKKRAPTDTFTASEVGTLVESLRNDIGAIADGVADIRKEVEGLKAWRSEVDGWRSTIDVWRVGMDIWRTGLDKTLASIQAELAALRADLKSFDERLRAVEAKVGL